MNAADAQQLWVVFWNYETGIFGIETVSDATLSGRSRFEERANLLMLDKLSEEDRAMVLDQHRWVFLGLFDSEREASNYIVQITNFDNE